MFRLLGVILRPSIEPNQDYPITSALRDPLALTIGGINAVCTIITLNPSLQINVTLEKNQRFKRRGSDRDCFYRNENIFLVL
jgi:hypothetical protein